MGLPGIRPRLETAVLMTSRKAANILKRLLSFSMLFSLQLACKDGTPVHLDTGLATMISESLFDELDGI